MPVRLRSPKRLRVEPLEGRDVPATFAVTTFADVVDPADGKLSLREAVSRANANPGPDTIQLKAGVYSQAPRSGSEDANVAGDFDVTDSLTVTGVGRAATVITGTRNDRLFELFGPIQMTFNNLALHGGGTPFIDGGAIQARFADVALNNCLVTQFRGARGGAINTDTGAVTVRNSRLANNHAASDGGAIRADAGRLVVDGSTIIGNSAATVGGGLFDDTGAVTVTRSTVMFNTAGRAGGGIGAANGNVAISASSVRGNLAGEDGGGIFAGGEAVLTNCSVTGNRAATGSGGGVRAEAAPVRRSTVSGNRCQFFGGGIAAQTMDVSNTTVSGNTSQEGGGGLGASDLGTVTNSTISGNTAGSGGGGIGAEAVNLTNVTISGNTAGAGTDGIGEGGGVSAAHGTILNCTIVENRTVGSVDALGAGIASGTGGDNSIRVRNTIVARNFDAFGVEQDVFGAYLSQGNNLIGEIDANSTGFGAAGDLVGSDDDPIDPLLGDLANNGGPTKTHALLPGSPAIDHGNSAGAPTSDQRGLARPRDGDGNGSKVIDIGAFER